MNELRLTRALRDTLELQSAAAQFFGSLARQAIDSPTQQLLEEFAHVEQLLVEQVEAMAAQLTSAPLPAQANARVAGIKTAPEWASVDGITFEQAIAIALDCTRRAYRHHMSVAKELDGRGAKFVRMLAQSDEKRAGMLAKALHQRLSTLFATRPIEDVLGMTLDSVRRSSRLYARLSKTTTRAQTREFLRGMVEVCSLHAASILKLAPSTSEQPSEFEPMVQATLPKLDCNAEDMDFEAAMQMAMNAQKRAALVHGMQARACSGEHCKDLLDIAEAERTHAATIAAVLDRLTPEVDEFDIEPVTALADAPRQSWTCPAPVSSVSKKSLLSKLLADLQVPPIARSSSSSH